jgi:hypothetical protein
VFFFFPKNLKKKNTNSPTPFFAKSVAQYSIGHFLMSLLT